MGPGELRSGYLASLEDRSVGRLDRLKRSIGELVDIVNPTPCPLSYQNICAIVAIVPLISADFTPSILRIQSAHATAWWCFCKRPAGFKPANVPCGWAQSPGNLSTSCVTLHHLFDSHIDSHPNMLQGVPYCRKLFRVKN